MHRGSIELQLKMVVARVQVVIEVVEEAGASPPWEEASKGEEVVNLEAEAEASNKEEIEEEEAVVEVASDKVSLNQSSIFVSTETKYQLS